MPILVENPGIDYGTRKLDLNIILGVIFVYSMNESIWFPLFVPKNTSIAIC